MAIFFRGGCLPLLLCITILLSFSAFPSSFSSFLPHQRHLLQSNSPQNIETFFPTFSVPALPSQTPPPTSHPPSLNPPTSPNLSPTPSPLPTTSSSRAVAKAVAATAAGTLVFAGLFFFFLQRCALARRRRRKMEKTTQVISSPRRDEETAVSYDAFKLMNGTLKGLVVDENGLDVLYWRQLEGRGGDGRKVFKKEVLDREPRREKRSAGGRGAGSLDRPRREKRDGRGRAGAVSHANSDPITRIPSNSSSAASSQISPYELQFPDLLRSPPQRIAAAVGAEAFSTLKTENPPPPPHVLVKEASDTPPALPTPESKNLAPPPPPPPPLPVKKNPAPPPPLPVKKNPAPPPPPPPPPPVKKNPGAPPPPPPPLPGRKNSAPPPLPPRPGSLRPSSSRGRVGSGGGGGSKKMAEAVASSSASKETEVGPQTKLKPLHWDKLTASSEHSMVWDKIGNGSFQ